MYRITNQISGHSFNINNLESILEAGLKQGINLPYGCQKGLCGKCKGLVIDGEISHTNPLTKGLEESEFEQGYVLMCQCQALGDVTIAIDELVSTSNIQSKIYPCKVISIENLNHDVAQLTLKIPSDDTMQFLAGQYIDLLYKDFEPRSFSIANSPNSQGIIELHIRLVDGGKFTHFIFNQLAENSLLRLEGPKGSFYLRDNNKPIIMLAGGTGFGPIKSMIESSLLAINKPVMIYWGVRTKVDLYSELPYLWAQQYKHISFIPILSSLDNNWSGRTGFVHQAVLEDYDDLSSFEVYACGAPIMVNLAAESFVKKGLPQSSFYSDAFEFQQPNK